MSIPSNKAEILPWLFSGPRLVVLLTLGVVIVVALVWAFSGTDVPTGKGKDLIVNTARDEGKNAVVANLVANQDKELDHARENSNQAGNALNVSVNRPAGEFDGSWANVNGRYCRDFPADPACRRH